MTATVSNQPTTDATPDPLEFGGVDHVEWWVGNARSFAGFLAAAFGFSITGYAGPETGRTDRVSYLVTQGDIAMVITSSLDGESEIARHATVHGDGVRDVALQVRDAAAAYAEALKRGATGIEEPSTDSDDHGSVGRAAIATYGETQHSFIARGDYDGLFLPGFEESPLLDPAGNPVGLFKIDHIVANVEEGHLEGWVDFYRRIFGFDRLVHFDDSQISTDYTALMSTVVWDGSKVVFPINEPAEGKKKSQIEEYLDFYKGPGVQHMALRTDDIISTVAELRRRGVRFLQVPDSYYVEAKERMAGIDLPWDAIAELGILVDRDHDGHLLQVFTEPVTGRPTFFFEVIQREGAKGFGVGNFKALFEAIEREQDRRGNL